MASIGFLIGGALVNALAFTGSNSLFSSLSKESIDKERRRHDKAIEDLQRAQIEWAKKRQEQLDYINSEIAKEHKVLSYCFMMSYLVIHVLKPFFFKLCYLIVTLLL